MINKKRCFKIDKLVRDKIPEIMYLNGITTHKRVMEKKEYIGRLKDKLIEEAQEVLEARNHEEMLDELADVLEALIVLGSVHEFSFEDIETARTKKKVKKGGFEDGIYSSIVEIDSSNKEISYYLERPDKYPEIK
jgi:predicted house-cleaning noncanonical NTP pyrophosphatase (MazG superfamily)